MTIRSMSEKRRAKLAAEGNPFPFSTITKKAKPPKRSTKRIRDVNPESAARRKVRQRSKHAKYMQSETRKVVDARANGQCEHVISARQVFIFEGEHLGMGSRRVRCEETTGLQHHHKRYGHRYGGNELPSDMLKVCRRCHEWLESQKPAGNRRSRSRS